MKNILLLLVVVTGCRKAHLGDDQTLAARNAFAAQVASKPARTPTFGADDADATLRARRLPRGAIHVLRRAAAQDGLIVACEDARVLPEEKLDVPALGLREYQSRAVEKLDW